MRMIKLVLLISLFAVFSLSCGFKPLGGKEEAKPSKVAADKKPEDFVKTQLKAFRNADFDYIYVIRSKDGEKLTSEDKQFIKNNTNPSTNRRTLSRDGKIVCIGSNFKTPDEGVENLKLRFDLIDHSKSPEQIEKQKEDRKAAVEKQAKRNEVDRNTPQKTDRSRFSEESDAESQEPLKTQK